MSTPPLISAPAALPQRSAPTNPDCPKANHPTIQHTRAADYNRGCRCPEAREQRRLQVKRRNRTPSYFVDATGTRRRLHALMAIGWRQDDLAARLGRTTLGPLLGRRDSRLVTRRIHDAVVALYDQLWNTPGPSRVTEQRTRANGWGPPMWWDDDLIDDPTYTESYDIRVDDLAIVMKSRTARRRERLTRVADLTSRGWSSRQIAAELGIHQRQVVRDRADLSTSPETVTAWQVAS